MLIVELIGLIQPEVLYLEKYLLHSTELLLHLYICNIVVPPPSLSSARRLAPSLFPQPLSLCQTVYALTMAWSGKETSNVNKICVDRYVVNDISPIVNFITKFSIKYCYT